MEMQAQEGLSLGELIISIRAKMHPESTELDLPWLKAEPFEDFCEVPSLLFGKGSHSWAVCGFVPPLRRHHLQGRRFRPRRRSHPARQSVHGATASLQRLRSSMDIASGPRVLAARSVTDLRRRVGLDVHNSSSVKMSQALPGSPWHAAPDPGRKVLREHLPSVYFPCASGMKVSEVAKTDEAGVG